MHLSFQEPIQSQRNGERMRCPDWGSFARRARCKMDARTKGKGVWWGGRRMRELEWENEKKKKKRGGEIDGEGGTLK